MSKIVISYQDLKRLSKDRFEEGIILADKGKTEGAYYLLGYAIENALKACICKKMGLEEYPPNIDNPRSFMTHKIDDLIVLAGLSKELVNKQKDTKFEFHWKLIKQWNTEFRYQKAGTIDTDKLAKFLVAINHKEKGVLSWLKEYW